MLKKEMKIFYLGFLVCSVIGCSSLAHRSYSCRKTQDLFGYSLIGGFLFQVGDCAPFKYFNIEAGDYYRMHKENILNDINSYSPGLGSKTYPALDEFAESYNCKKESFFLFSSALYENKENILGNKYEKGPREVSLAILEMIEGNLQLKTDCH